MPGDPPNVRFVLGLSQVTAVIEEEILNSQASDKTPAASPNGIPDDFNYEIGVLVASRVLRSVAAGMISVAFPYYILSTLHYGAFVIGMIYVAATIATALFGLLFGTLADLWGRKPSLLVASFFLPVSAILVYLSGSLWVIFPAAMLGGFSATGSLAGGGVGGVVAPIQNAVLTGLTTEAKRTRYFSVLTFISGTTAALGSLLSRLVSVRGVFLVAMLISLAGTAILILLHVPSPKGKMTRLNAKVTIGKFTLTGMLNGFSQGLVIPFLIPFFVLLYHLPKSEMAIYAFIGGLAGSFSLLAAPLLEKRLGFVGSIITSRGIGALLFVAFPLVHILAVSLLIYVIAPAFRVVALPIQQSELTKRVDNDEIGRALGINQVARLAASSTGTGLSGLLMDAAAFGIPFFAYGAIMVGNLYLYLRFFGGAHARVATPEAQPTGSG